MLVDAGADVSCVDSDHVIPIICTAVTGNLEMTTLLLDAGVDLFKTDWGGMSVFAAAFTLGDNPSLVEMLLVRGGLAPEGEKNNYLFTAIANGWYNVTKLLIQKGADMEYKPLGEPLVPLLVVAIIVGHFDIAELLIQQGANVKARCHDQSTALHFTRQEKHLSLVKCLLAAGADVSAIDSRGCQPLMLAECVAIVEVLLANGANCDHACSTSQTPLLMAVMSRRHDTVKALLQAGASTRGSGETSIVQIACQIGDPRLVGILLDYDADISANNSLGSSALIISTSAGHSSVVKLLLERGAGVKEEAEGGLTPLMVAARDGHNGIVNILIDHGADLEHADKQSCTALLSAAEEGQTGIVDILLSKGANIQVKDCEGSNALISAAAFPNSIATVNRLLRDGRMDVDAQNLFGRSALFNAAMRGQADVVARLLAHQPPADVTIRDHWGTTALSMAVRNGHTRVVDMLLAAHDPGQPILSIKDNQGRTVLDWARRTAVGKIWRMLAATREGATVDIIEDADNVMMRFQPTKCYCYVCGRCSICEVGMLRVCSPCYLNDEDTGFCICKFCDEEGIKCVRGHNFWTAGDCQRC